MIINLKFELIVTMFLTLFCATVMGLAISTMVTSNDRAMSIAPFFLIPQIIFSGFIFKLSGITDKLSHVIIAKWSLRALAVSMRINELPLRAVDENKDNSQLVGMLKQMKRVFETAYDHDINNLYTDWIVLCSIVLCCIIISMLSLKLKERK